MSKPVEMPEAEAPKGPSSATGRDTEVSTNTVVEDNTEQAIPNPYAREAKVVTSKAGDGKTILESYS